MVLQCISPSALVSALRIMNQSGWGGVGRHVSEGISTYTTIKEGNLESHTWVPLLLSCISIMQDGNNLDWAVFDVE